MWLAQVGSNRLDEIADPEKAIQRGAAFYIKISILTQFKLNWLPKLIDKIYNITYQ